MPDPHESAPDSVSFKELSQFLEQAPGDDDDETPVGTSVPVLPLGIEDFGAADLVLTLEQLIKASGRVTILHLLHASGYLLATAAHYMEEGCKREAKHGSEGFFFRATVQALIASLRQTAAGIDSFVGPLTVMHATRLGGRHGSRAGLISDGTLEALGLDKGDFDRRWQRVMR